MTPTSHSVVHGCELSTNGAQHITMFAWIRKQFCMGYIMDNIWFSVVEINHPEEGPLLLLEGARKRYPGSFLFRKELGSWR